MGCLLLAFALALCAALPAHAADCVADLGGVLDGFVTPVPPSQINIDGNCTIKNFPASNPLSTNFSFFTSPGNNNERWLVIFDNVDFVGNMSCNKVLGNAIWFVNGSTTTLQPNCQNLFIPVEKIDKKNPAGTTTASIGVPFTYTLTIPVLFSPLLGIVIDDQGSPNDLHSVVVTDDLNATGVDLTFVSYTAVFKSTGTPVPLTFSNVGNVLTFNIAPIIPAGEQILIQITVVLNDTPINAPGTQFINTAKWEFGRLIDGVFYQPLPGESGISPPLTISSPDLVVTKTGPATLGKTLNLGEWGTFNVDVANNGNFNSWDVSIRDLLPDGPTGGMCDQTPQILGVTLGGTPLTLGTQYTTSYAGPPTCQLSLDLLDAAGPIAPGEHLVISYRTRLDSDSQDGVTLTNIVGATQWSNDQSTNASRQTYTRTITNGTPGVSDFQDAHTVTVALFGYFYEKTVADLTSGANPATTALPGDRLRYTLRLQATDVPLDDISFHDDMGAMNATPVFVPGSLALVASTIPPGADTSNTNPNGGTNGAGILDIRNLNVPANSQILIQFDITASPSVADGTIALNQADLLSANTKISVSDDPFINGQSDPSVAGDEDPTPITIQVPPPNPLLKADTQTTAAIGVPFRYRITVPATPYPYPMYDVRITDNLAASAANMHFVSATKVSGSQPWTPVNTGTATNLVIQDPTVGIDIPAGEQAVVEITVVLDDTPTNVAGLTFTNTSDYTFDRLNQDPTSQRPGAPGTTQPMTIVEPLLTFQKAGPATMTIGVPQTFTFDVHNTGGATAFNVILLDRLPHGATGGMCDVAPSAVTAQLFQADNVTPVSGALVAGTDFSVAFAGAPTCELTLTILTNAGAIGSDQHLHVSYQTQIDASTQNGVALTNVAGATQWKSADAAAPLRRTYTRTLTDGTVGVLDFQDAHTVTIGLPGYLFEKTVSDVTTGANPAATATPGDRLRYRIRILNQGTTPLDNLSLFDELDRLNDPPVFAPGTLTLVTVPAGADTSNTSATGGAKGTGVVDVRNLSVAASSEVVIEFEITLAPAIANGRYVTNQSQLRINGTPFALSDDPNVNGPADPFVSGDEDPTRVLITSAPAFRVQKVSADVTGDPNILLPGDTLRYTITVKNVGTANATDAELRDAVPVDTHYVAGSTTLNGVPVPDGAGGTSPLATGILINAPENPTPGAMRADASATTSNVATIVFDVVVDAGVPDGTVISNQGFVSAPGGGVFDQPSDDPRTPIADDPTRNVVGSTPLLFAPKTVALAVDAGTPGVVDPGDVLRYTITVYNTGAVPATNVVLTDAVPANTTYVANTTTLNGLPVAQPDGGVSPLVAGIGISSSDLTPPLPGPSGGTLSVGQSAVITFEVQVNAGVPGGTVISNQGIVHTKELPNLGTDGDGDPTTGPEPTVVVVGNAQQLTITKQVAVVGGGAALAGSQLEYLVRVTNIAAVPAYSVVITDDLDAVTPGTLAYVAGSATLNGSATGVSVVGSVITADYSTTYGPLAPSQTVTLRFRATINASLAIGTRITNTGVVHWNTPEQTASASVSIDVGGMPGVGSLNGTVWHDANFDKALDGSERTLQGWIVDLYRNGSVLKSVITDAAGKYGFTGLVPNAGTADRYELRFRAPDAGPSSASLGNADSPFTNGPQRITDIVVASGSDLQNLNLPITPNGVVYGAIDRTPIAGATLRLQSDGGADLPSTCFDDPVQQGQVTRSDGFYKFDLNFSDAACPAGGSYLIAIAPPGSGFTAGYSQLIPPITSAATAPLSVPTCPGTAADAVPSTIDYCEAQASELAPPPSVQARTAGTNYYVHLTFDASRVPGSSQIFNNHIPLDPVLTGAVAITKTTPARNVTRGQLVPYEITLTNKLGPDLTDVSIVDRFPAGFRYVQGSARVDGVPVEPTTNGQTLVWPNLTVPSAGHRTLQLLLAVGAGVNEGEFVNRARAQSTLTGVPLSGEAHATVRVVPDPTFDCTDVIGKVFDDANRNGVQDDNEPGLQGVRVVTLNGLAALTDRYGRFHIACAVTPYEGRGSNFVLKLDDRTLPTGFRMSTRQVQVERATRGKVLRFRFGASIHHVVGLDLADDVFEPGSTEMRPQWRPRIDKLLDELKKGPSTLRLSYIADVEDEKLVKDRLAAVKDEIMEAWEGLNAGYRLTIEPEVFWRRGGPPKRDSAPLPDGR